jgi:hypothetical protein
VNLESIDVARLDVATELPDLRRDLHIFVDYVRARTRFPKGSAGREKPRESKPRVTLTRLTRVQLVFPDRELLMSSTTSWSSHSPPAFGGADEVVEEGGVGADTVDRHLQGEHAGILGGTADEAGHGGVEALVGVVDQQVTGPDDREDIAVLAGQGRRHQQLQK